MGDKSILIGNGMNINFGGPAYSNEYIVKRIIFNARANKYAPLFNGEIGGNEIELVFTHLTEWVNEIAGRVHDRVITSDDDKKVLDDFKHRYANEVKRNYEIGLEDWLFVIRMFFLTKRMCEELWEPLKQGVCRMILDAIYNDGDIQSIYKRMGKPVKRWLLEYDNIFTLNYDNNLDDLTGRQVFHLHGDFRTLADSENPKTLLGQIKLKEKGGVVVPGFEHCFCNALLDYAGGHKYEIARAFEKGAEGLRSLGKSGIPSVLFPAPIEKLLKAHKEHPELAFGSNYHFAEFEELTGELHIIGMSPNNDAHIFKLIDESNIEKVVFYYFSDREAKSGLPVHQKVEYKSAQELWKRLKVAPKRYACNYLGLTTTKINEIVDAINRLSGDHVTPEEATKGANSIPQFRAAELCKVVLANMSVQYKSGSIKNDEDLLRCYHEVSRLALRNGILPSALYLHVIMGMNASK